MNLRSIISETLQAARLAPLSLAALQLAASPVIAATAGAPTSWPTASPIKHVIVIIGENRTFDHVFATYVPKQGESVNNLLSEGIIALDPNLNAIPGPHFNRAHQLAANDQGLYQLSPRSSRSRMISCRRRSPGVRPILRATSAAPIPATTGPSRSPVPRRPSRVWRRSTTRIS